MQTIVRKMTVQGNDYMIEVEVDLENMVRYLGEKAARNRTKRSRMAFAKAKARPTLETRKKAALAAINEFVAEETR